MASHYPKPHIDLDAFSTVFVEHQQAAPRETGTRYKRRLKFSVFFIALLATWTFVFTRYAPESAGHIWDIATANKAIVTGILYDAENPRAIVCGQIARVGDTVNEYQVSRINRDSVELLRNGRLITEQIKNKPGIAKPTWK